MSLRDHGSLPLCSTSVLPQTLLDKLQENLITPMATMIRCFDTLAGLEKVRRDDWVETGPVREILERNMDKLISHTTPTRPSPDEATRLKMQQADLVAAAAYAERNHCFAREEKGE